VVNGLSSELETLEQLGSELTEMSSEEKVLSTVSRLRYVPTKLLPLRKLSNENPLH